MDTQVRFGYIYIGNKMSGIPFFNAPWFDETAGELRAMRDEGWLIDVFNPADEDRARGFEPMNCPEGTMEEAQASGFVLRSALGADWAYIAEYSDGLIVGPDWAKSPGTISEIACHQALRLPVWEWQHFRSAMNNGMPDLLLEENWQFPSLTKYLI